MISTISMISVVAPSLSEMRGVAVRMADHFLYEKDGAVTTITL